MKSKMKKNKGQSRIDLTKRLAGYSLTAGVVLASGSKVQAGIQYSGPISHDFGTDSVDYDLKMEGSAEARFWGMSSITTNYTMSNIYKYTSRNAGFGVYRLNNNFQVPNEVHTTTMAGTVTYVDNTIRKLPVSNMVGPNNNTPNKSYGTFFNTHSVHSSINSYVTSSNKGNWMQNGQSGYFGFSFELENESASGAQPGTTVYGWGLVKRIDESNGRLLGWAYEDSGRPMHVGTIPAPSALGLAALGAAGVLSMRRRKKA